MEKTYCIKIDKELHDEAVKLSKEILGKPNFQGFVRKLVMDAVKQAKTK